MPIRPSIGISHAGTGMLPATALAFRSKKKERISIDSCNGNNCLGMQTAYVTPCEAPIWTSVSLPILSLSDFLKIEVGATLHRDNLDSFWENKAR